MILPRGITGFGNINTDPPLFLDEKAFCRMCHALAQENGGAVTEVDTDTAIRNFYSAKLSRYNQSVFMLQNIHFSLCGLCPAGRLRQICADRPAGVAPASRRPGAVSEF